MFNALPSLQKLVRQLQKVPYLASKNIYRVAIHFLMSKNEEVQHFCDVLLQARKNIGTCNICFNLTQNADQCAICSSDKREKSVICVVETWHDLFAIEKAGGYNGSYHVLGGSICPLEGVGPDNLHIDSVIALGCKGEQPVIEDIKDSVEYWRDKNDILHVPKRRLKDIIHINKF